MSKEYTRITDTLYVYAENDLDVNVTFREGPSDAVKKVYKRYDGVEQEYFSHRGVGYTVLKVNGVLQLFRLDHIADVALAPGAELEYIGEARKKGENWKSLRCTFSARSAKQAEERFRAEYGDLYDEYRVEVR